MPWSEAKYIPEPNSGCWLWLASLQSKGYGSQRYQGRSDRAHCVSYKIHCGPIPEGRIVCHTCDTRICVNPDHLYLGTPQSNMDDRVKRGRWKGGRKPKGVNPHARWAHGDRWWRRHALEQ